MSITDIDLSQLTEQELRQLNRAIVLRLRLLSSARSLAQVAQFQRGDAVEFEDQTSATITGIVVHCYQKTLTLV